jgi:hypothetical protein
MVIKGWIANYSFRLDLLIQKKNPERKKRKRNQSCVLFRGMVQNGIPRICIYFGSAERNSELCSLPENGSEQNYGSLLLFLFHGTEFRVISSSTEGFGTEFRDFRRMVRNRIMGVCFYFCSTEWNSELFPLPRKGSERNSEIFCSAEQPEFRRK